MASGSDQTIDVLAIAAHRDDVEQTCGGTLLRMAARGLRTGVLDLTQGESGTRGTAAERAAEAEEAGRILGVSHRQALDLPDGAIANTLENKLKLASVIRELRPRTVILPYWEARHPDHYHAATLGYEGCFLAGLKQLPIPGEPHRPFKILYATSFENVRPTFVVDISAQYERRRRAILAYRSQFRPAASERKGGRVYLAIDELEEQMNQLSRHFGQMIGVKYGEPFLVKELMIVEDVVSLGVRSI